jgi:hypothetical protein
MNPKLILSGVLAVVLLSGCASEPQAPEDNVQMTKSDNFLNVPVDITKFTPSKMKIYGSEAGEGQISIFTDPASGKTYDLDGQPVNEKGERILRDGYVCEVKVIALGRRGYVGEDFWSTDEHLPSCYTSAAYATANSSRATLLGGAIIGPIATLAALGVNSTRIVIQTYTADDTL